MRYEHDSLGELALPDEAYYGINTERGRRNFAVSGISIGHFPMFIHVLAKIKKATAITNADIDGLATPIMQAICQACDEIVSSKIRAEQFPVDVIQGGGCISTHMNINEVIANRANEIITGAKGYDFVHPNNHVNMGQSTNDVLPTALKLTVHFYLLNLINSLGVLEEILEEKVAEFADVVKLSRTCLQDAVPITLGQEFSAYLSLVRRSIKQLEFQADMCLDVPLGATAVGTSLGVRPGYLEKIYGNLSKVMGVTVRRDENFFDGLQNGDFFVQLSGTIKSIATGLSKMATDLRILSSGNRSGMKEIVLPAVQAGSSIMPGKINPSYPELINQVAYLVCGNDLTITMAVEGIELDLNIWDSIISKSLFESLEVMTRSIVLFAHNCVKGIEANREECASQAENTLSLALVVSMVFGYEVGVKVAKHAHKEGLSIKHAAIELGVLTPDMANDLLDVYMLTDSKRSGELVNQMAQKQKDKVRKIIHEISPETRHLIFDIMTRMTWADSQMSAEEAMVLEVTAEALQLDKQMITKLSSKSGVQVATMGMWGDELMQLSMQERELAYICGAWLSEVDDEVAGEELALLEDLREASLISMERATYLKRKVHQIHAHKAELVPQWEASPWWEEFERLLVQALELVKK
ncbi:MAG: aspartate ammonia-lyase [Bacteroidetes bacterium]|nr:MAG: aspartate ammonia-lyase [Bacteroidota bacterium]